MFRTKWRMSFSSRAWLHSSCRVHLPKQQSDKVGIGTSTSQAKLTIEGDTGQTNNLFVIASSTINATGSAQGMYATIDNLGKTTLTGKVLNPTHVGSITDAGSMELDGATSIAISGNYAYIASEIDDGVEILDISDPTNPTHTGFIDNATCDATNSSKCELNGAYSIAVSGNYAYVASRVDNGVEILDISDPSNPTHAGSIDDTLCGTQCELGGALSIAISGNYAYVASRVDNGVEILDISDPTNPTHVGSIDDTNCDTAHSNECELYGAYSIFVSGNYAYVASDTDDGVEILDISDPSNPTHAGSITDAGAMELDGANIITVSGNYAYVAGYYDNGVEILDISDPTNPTHVGSIDDTLCGTQCELGGATSIAISGNYAYIAGYIDDGVQILDISDPSNPTHVGSITDAGAMELDGATSIAISGSYAYITGYDDDGLEILDIGALEVPMWKQGNIKTDNLEVQRKAQFDQDILVHGGLNVGHNALDRRSLAITGTASVHSGTLNSATTQPALTVASGFTGLGTTTPNATLSLAGQSGQTDWLFSVASSTIISSSSATSSQTNSSSKGFYATIDTLGKTTLTGKVLNPTHVGSMITPCDTAIAMHVARCISVAVSGDYAYVASQGDNGIEVLDISDPSNPTHIGSITDAGSMELAGAWFVTVSGNYAYVAE